MRIDRRGVAVFTGLCLVFLLTGTLLFRGAVARLARDLFVRGRGYIAYVEVLWGTSDRQAKTSDSSGVGFVIDHTYADLNSLPDDAIKSAREVRSVLRHASVGGNISAGLNDLQGIDDKYNYSAFAFSDRGNPGWRAKVDDLDAFVAEHLSEYAVFSQKFCFIDEDANWRYYRDHMEALEAAYPDKGFVWWTMPIRTDGSALRDAYNIKVRNYCLANGKILFDIADIESHDPAGHPIRDGRYEAMYSGYSSDGGHLDETTGRQRVATAYWWLMARLAELESTAQS